MFQKWLFIKIIIEQLYVYYQETKRYNPHPIICLDLSLNGSCLMIDCILQIVRVLSVFLLFNESTDGLRDKISIRLFYYVTLLIESIAL